MKIKIFLLTISFLAILFLPGKVLSQAPTLGAAANFVLYTSNGAVSNTGVSQFTGDIGARIGAITGFGNVNGQFHTGDAVCNQASTDLLTAYGKLNTAVSTATIGPTIGNGVTLSPAVYFIAQPATLNGFLTFDAAGDSNAVFIVKINGTFSTNSGSKILLKNGALACNVFWKVEGAVTLASGSSMKGTIVANNASITLNSGDTLEGRALSTTGAIVINGSSTALPLGCGSVVLKGPVAPALASTACYTIFSGNGSVINTGISFVTGDIGSNTGSVTGFDSLNVTGKIHPSPDTSTGICANDLITVYNYLNTLPYDIQLSSPSQFGRNIVLTPHTYFLNSATTLTDTLYLDAQNNPNAVFVIKIVGALSTSTYSRVRLLNGAQPKNIYWHVVGAVSINDYSIFVGTVVCSGAIELRIGADINGRTLTTGGAVNTVAIKAVAPPGCASCPDITIQPISQTTVCAGDSVKLSVVATGSGLTYQWRKGTTLLVNSATISGAMSDTLVIKPVSIADSSAKYNVIVSGSCAISDTSNFAALNVNTPPVITTEPIGRMVCAGASVNFLVKAKGTNLMYQWRIGNTPLSNSGNVSGANSDSLVITGVTTADTASNYNVLVTGTCAPNDTSVFVTLKVNTLPDSVGPITGPTVVCRNQSGIVYSVSTAPNTTSYVWTVPAGATITGTATGNSITVSFSAGAVSGNLTVRGVNACGNGPISTTTITVNALPDSAGIVSGPSSVCKLQAGYMYSVPVIANATSYHWTVPAGFIITSGATSNTITVSVSAGAVSGVITAQGINSCGSGKISANFTVVVNSAAAGNAGAITGSSPVCQGQSGVLYFVSAIANATDYTWTVPAGATITSGDHTDSILVAFSTSAVSGNITVQGSNGCGSGTISANFPVTVNSLPATPGLISGPTTVCQNQSGLTYSITTIPNANSYVWTVPAGATITGTTTGNSITVSFSNAAISGNITVRGVNACGNGLPSTTVITVNTLPDSTGSISGPSTVCKSQAGYMYSVPVIANATSYQWTVPAGFTITSGATSNTITVSVSAGAISGVITAQGINSCGNGTVSANFAVVVNSAAAGNAGAITGSSPVCQGQSGVLYFVSAIANATDYTWTLPAGATITSGDHTDSILVAFSTSAVSGNITLQGSNGCGSGAASILAVTVTTCGFVDLSVIKTVSNTQPAIGEIVVFTLEATNTGTLGATGVVVTDALQSGYTFISASSADFNPATGNWNIGNLAAGAAVYLQINLQVKPTGNYVNTASIVSNETDSAQSNNQSSATTFPAAFKIPAGFSPNGDGVNDLYVIRGISFYPGNTLTIFDRWGDKVYEAAPYINSWDGKANKGVKVGSDDSPIGTYFYVLTLGDGSAAYKGTIYLSK